MEQIQEWWEALAPFAPYIGVAILVDQIMRLGIRPLIKRHREPSGSYGSKLWLCARRCQFLYPPTLGILVGWAATASGVPSNLFWCGVSGASAQWAVHAARDWAKTKGYELPDPRNSLV